MTQHRNNDTRKDSEAWHAQPIEDVLERLAAPRDGLSAAEARRRLARHGRNVLREQQGPGVWQLLLGQFRSVVILVLLAAGIAAVAMQRWPESVAIAAVILINTAIGFVSEWKAQQSMEALRELGRHHTRVRRDGSELEIDAVEVVPGDVVVLGGGDLVPADLRVLEAEGLSANESALTGESVPVSKQAEPTGADAVLSDRHCMLFKGTSVVDGRAVGLAVATGDDTEVGRISALAQTAEAAATPLQRKLDRLGRHMAVIVLVTAACVGGAGLLAGREPLLMIETAIALGVAAIPEGLPIVATIALARGMWLMAQRHTVVNRLPAVETLGATRVIFTDKTGTLTENRMRAHTVVTSGGRRVIDEDEGQDLAPGVLRVLRVGVLCNTASEVGEAGDDAPERGDPMEIALLEAGRACGITRDGLFESMPCVETVPFDRDVMMMATVHDSPDGRLVAVKGAPEAVLEACTTLLREDGEVVSLDDEQRRRWIDGANELASTGLRLLAMAEGKQGAGDDDAIFRDLCLLGFVGLYDPPRTEVKEAIDACQHAGIRVVMVTGDKPETAEAIAEQAGIVGDPEDDAARVMLGQDLKDPEALAEADRERIHRSNIFARVTPEQKLNLVGIYQGYGETVAMTGDGINDAPALRKADIGIAMGRRGTDAAREVSDMVLEDDAFETIVAAVEQGRVIFGNIRKSVLFMLCTNGAEVLAVAVASLLSVPIPLRPLQILYLNVLTDVLPALALGVGRGGAVMRDPPRDPREAVLTRRHWLAIGAWSVVIAACVLAGLLVGLSALGLDEPSAVTVAFLTLGFGKLWFVFNLRGAHARPVINEITRNGWIWGALGVCTVLLVAAVHVPGLTDVLDTRPLGASSWLTMLGLSVVPLVVGQLWLWWRKRTPDTAPVAR